MTGVGCIFPGILVLLDTTVPSYKISEVYIPFKISVSSGKDFNPKPNTFNMLYFGHPLSTDWKKNPLVSSPCIIFKSSDTWKWGGTHLVT